MDSQKQTTQNLDVVDAPSYKTRLKAFVYADPKKKKQPKVSQFYTLYLEDATTNEEKYKMYFDDHCEVIAQETQRDLEDPVNGSENIRLFLEDPLKYVFEKAEELQLFQ